MQNNLTLKSEKTGTEGNSGDKREFRGHNTELRGGPLTRSVRRG
jgi:hypothetical protein